MKRRYLQNSGELITRNNISTDKNKVLYRNKDQFIRVIEEKFYYGN